jgi:hypothetical protein
MKRSQVSFSVLFFVCAGGCSGSDGAPSGAGGAQPDANATGGAAGALVDADVRDQGTAAFDADFIVEDASAHCNDLVNTAPVIVGQKVAMDLPVPSGGTMADGTYYETSFTLYTGPGGETGPEKEHQLTVVLAGRTAQVVQLYEGVQRRFTLSIENSGTMTNWTILCPRAGLIPYGYDANATRIVMYVNNATQKATFTLQRQ